MASITTGTDIICPHCHTELEITTKGILGGILAQMLAGLFVNRLKSEGGTITCGHCKDKFRYIPK